MEFLLYRPRITRLLHGLSGAALMLSAQAWAQAPIQADVAQPPTLAPTDPVAVPPGPRQVDPADEIAFSADLLEYDDNADIVTATGNVIAVREGNRLRADKVVWNRTTGRVDAIGNVSTTDVEGNVAYGDTLEVTDTLKDGIAENLLLVMTQGGRLVARRGELRNGIYYLDQAAYSPCSVNGADGCAKEPSWQLKAVKVRYDPARERVYYKTASLELFGIPLGVWPGFSHPTGNKGGSGFLLPDFRLNGLNGFELAQPYYVKLAQNRDMTVTPHLFTNQAPMLEASYRATMGRGAYNVLGYVTNSEQSDGGGRNQQFRGYIETNGTYRFSPEWRLYGSVRRATDRTFLRRYSINGDDRLRSTMRLERIDNSSYFSLAGWAVQTMRLGDDQRQMPLALPVIDYRRRMPAPLIGGQLQIQANSIAISRNSGQDTQRAFIAAEWKLRKLTAMGQEIALTAYTRGDAYHSNNTLENRIATYRGREGWRTRGIAALAADVRWPFVGPIFGGSQRIVPRVQIVAAPNLRNLSVPNEDARSVDLEDSNLFALNRFAGYDRFEDSTRITVGLEYGLSLKNFSLENVFGQSYRLNRRPTLLPDGTGLTDRTSDFVGRTTVRYKDFLSVTHRFRLDKNNLAVRRNEVDATIGTRRTYAIVSYLRLDRNVTRQLEDLADREEVRLGARVALARYWSIFGSTVVDLTDSREAPGVATDGYDPVYHRLGVDYRDDCLNFSLVWRRSYVSSGDARVNNTYQLRLAFRNLGI